MKYCFPFFLLAAVQICSQLLGVESFLLGQGQTKSFGTYESVAPSLIVREASALPVINDHKEKDVNLYHLLKTAGGFLAQMEVTTPTSIEPSKHTILVGEDFLTEVYSKISPELDVADETTVRKFYDCVLDFMLDRGIKLKNTEGLIDGSIFPVNYFTVKQLTYFYDNTIEDISERLKRNL